MTRRQRRHTVIGAARVVLAAAIGLALSAMRDTIVYFRSPSEIASAAVQPGSRMRLGGLVEAGSVKRQGDQRVEFSVSDGAASVPVRYRGLQPDQFREGQGVVTEGTLDTAGVINADTELARHDETYMPREAADAPKAQGRRQGPSPPQRTTQK